MSIDKPARILCACCKNPIHIDDLGVVQGKDNLEEWFHKDCFIYLSLSLQQERERIINPLMEFAEFNIRQKAIRYPDYVRGVNDTGAKLKHKLESLSQPKEE